MSQKVGGSTESLAPTAQMCACACTAYHMSMGEKGREGGRKRQGCRVIEDSMHASRRDFASRGKHRLIPSYSAQCSAASVVHDHTFGCTCTSSFGIGIRMLLVGNPKRPPRGASPSPPHRIRQGSACVTTGALEAVSIHPAEGPVSCVGSEIQGLVPPPRPRAGTRGLQSHPGTPPIPAQMRGL